MSNFSTPILDVLYGCDEIASKSINVNISLLDGWNWVSLNITDDDDVIKFLFSDFNGNVEFIKSYIMLITVILIFGSLTISQ